METALKSESNSTTPKRSGGGDDLPGAGAHVTRVEVQAGDSVAGLRVLGLLLDGDGVEVGVELHDAEALGVVDVVAEHGGEAAGLRVLHGAARVLGLLLDGDGVEVGVELHDAEALGVVDVVAEHGGEAAGLRVLHGAAQVSAQAVAVEDVVAEHQGAGLAGGELLADDEGLREAVGAGLDGVGQVHAVVRPVAEQPLEVRKVRRGGDDQDVADAGHHGRRRCCRRAPGRRARRRRTPRR